MELYRCSKKAASENKITELDQLLKVFREYADKNATSDSLRFEFNQRYYVEIVHEASRGFFLNCRHEQHSFETLVPYDGVKTGFTIEEFLNDFWEHRVRQKYNFDENPEIRKADFTATASVPIWTFFPLLFFIVPFIFSAILKDTSVDKVQVLLKTELVVFILTAPYWILLIQYYAYSRNAVLRISQKEKLVAMERNGEEITIRFSEITKARIIRNEGRGSPIYGTWAYLRIEAGPQKRIIITDMMHDDLEGIGEMLDCKVVQEPSFYSIIRLKKKSEEDVAEEKAEFMEKSAELEKRWKNKSSQELEEVIRNADQYSDFAVVTARRMLERR